MRRLRISLSLLFVVALASACAAAASKSEAPSRGTVISVEEVRASGIPNAYDLVQSLRPAWLRSRGLEGASGAEVVVYLNETRMGGAEALRQIATATITSVQRFDARTAQFRWGSGHTQGVILVTMQ